MSERRAGERLRLVIGGSIYSRRALVRRFLEDDGFSVVAETTSAEELISAVASGEPDAIVVDADVVGGSLEPLRRVAPDAAIVVFGTPRAVLARHPAGADGYLEQGTGLASLTAMLHELLSEAPVPAVRRSGVSEPRPERRILSGLAGLAAGTVLVAVVTLAIFGTGVQSPAPPSVVPVSPTQTTKTGMTAIERARAYLRQLQAAIEAGRFAQAQTLLGLLDRQLALARRQDMSLSGFGDAVGAALQPLLGELGQGLLEDLRSVLGEFLTFPTSSTTGGGSTPPGATSGGPQPSADEGEGPIQLSGGSTGGGSTQLGGGSTGGSIGGGPTGGGAREAVFPGDGHHYGWVNKPTAGGWRGARPHPAVPVQLP